MAKVDELIIELKAKTDNIEAGMKRVESQMAKSTNAIKKQQADIQTAFAKTGTSIKNLAGVVGVGFGVNELRQFAVEAVKTSFRMESVANTLKAATGSAEAARAEFAFLKSETNRLGLNTLETAGAFARLTASARGTKFEGEGVREIFTAIATASSVLRLSSEDTSGAIRALEQMMSKGVVSMEELKLQLGDRLPGVMRLAAQAMKMPTDKLIELISAGKLATDDFLIPFSKAIVQDFAGGVEEASKSAQADINRLMNSFNDLQVALGNAITNSEPYKAGVKGLGNAFAFLAEKINIATGNLENLTDETMMNRVIELDKKISQLKFTDYAKQEKFGAAAPLFGGSNEKEIAQMQSELDQMNELRKKREVEALKLWAKNNPYKKDETKKGGGGGNTGDTKKAIKDAEKLADSLDDLQKQTSRDVYTHGMSELAAKLAEVDSLVEDLADKYGTKLTPAQEEQVQAIKDNITELDRLQQAQEDAEQMAQALGGAFSDAFEEGVLGAQSFGDVLDSLGKQIEKILFNQLVTQPLNDFFGGVAREGFGSIFGGMFGGGGDTSAADAGIADLYPLDGMRAGGGAVQKGGAYLVGEKRPEIFVPQTAGHIVPTTSGMGGGNTSVNVQVINNTGTQAEATVSRGSNGDIMVQLDRAMTAAAANPSSDFARLLGAYSNTSNTRR